MPRIAIDASLVGTEKTGDATYWSGLIEGLANIEADYEFLLLSNRAAPEGFALDSRFKWLRLRSHNRRWFSWVTMPRAAKAFGADAYHTQYTLSPLAGKRGITTIHDVSFFIGPEWFRAKDRALLQRLVRKSAKRAAKVITVSETSKRDIVKYLGVAASKVAVTYNGVHSRFKPVADAGAIVNDKFGIDGEYLLALGTRWPRKNFQLAARAAEMLGEDSPKLVVVGKAGWGESEAQSGAIIYTGYVSDEDLPALYSGAKLFLLPSRYEGFGIPMLEAFACGTPVLSSSGGALPEVSGGAAEICADLTPEAWAAKIKDLLSDSSKLSEMRDTGLRRAKDFTWENTARRTIAVYDEVVHD